MFHVEMPGGQRFDIDCLLDQVYSVEAEDGTQYHWNVTKGLRTAEARGELYTVSLTEMGVTVESVRRLYDGMDEAYAMSTDLSRPLLFVPFGGRSQLVDGWHRLFKAAALGVDTLFAYFLTQEEADRCLLLVLPPGQGIDWGQRQKPTAPHAKGGGG